MSAPAPGSSKPTQADAAAPKKKRGPGALATAYLVIYNVVMTAGWLVIAVGLVRAYLARGSYHGLYYSIEKPLKFFQTGAVLEVSAVQGQSFCPQSVHPHPHTAPSLPFPPSHCAKPLKSRQLVLV
ncbi:hypothetical protein CRUP_028130 [Coryphaenoides rupestris]|nr:hypothetical protein CRUP_028130 [Coryphaenoides rupestris]